MKHLAATNDGVREAAQIIRRGGLVAFGTETVYGLGADATNAAAVARVFEAKGRPRFDPLIVHLADAEDVPKVTAEWSPLAERLASTFWPGPLTIVAAKGSGVPDLVTSGLPDVAVRIPNQPDARRLIREAGCPIAAPSANPFGMTSPTTADHVLSQLDGRIDAVLDTGPCRVGLESTVVRTSGEQCTVLRPGGITAEALRRVAEDVRTAADEERAEQQAQASPGRLPRHYSPGVPVVSSAGCDADPSTGLLAFGRSGGDWPGPVEVLSRTGDLAEAAALLFAGMRSLKERGVRRIAADEIPETGLGVAINDRLRRARE